MLVCWQWRSVQRDTGPLWLGLDYAAVAAGLALSGTQITPGTWDEVRLIEMGAREALNGIEGAE